MRFDRKKFFQEYRKNWRSLSQQQVNGLERLLKGIENDPYIPESDGIFYAAYMLATVKRETAHTFTPIHEYGSKSYFIRRYGGQTRKGKELGNDTPEEGYFYAGKSDVQVTGESNYEKAESAIRREYPEIVRDFERRTGKTFDLTVGDQASDTSDPMNILDPAVSYAVMSYGMRTGMFTGLSFTSAKFKKLTGVPRYKAWRQIINGTDHDDEIAADAVTFEKCLRYSFTDSAVVSNDDSVTNQTQDAATPTPNQPTEQQPTPIETVTVNTPEPYMGVGFWGVIKRDLAAATGGNLSFTALSEYAQQASGWPDWVVGILTKVAIGALIATFGYFIFRVIHYAVDSWKKNEKVKTEAAANTSKDSFNIEWS